MPASSAVASYPQRLALSIAAFAVSLVVLPLLALLPTVVPLAWPGWLGNALFFWPQYLLLTGGVRAATPEAAAVGAGVLSIAAAAFWLLALAVFARVTLGWRKRLMLPALFLAVALITEVVLLALGAAGYVPVLDGL